MSKKIVENVDKQNPELLKTNIVSTVDRFTTLVVAELRAQGRQAFRIGKTQGEGQYSPPDFGQVLVEGRDGVGYSMTGRSHDAIWCDGEQFDIVIAGNDTDRKIYQVPGSDEVSFDPSSGPQIVGKPTWNPIPREYWRVNNPPLPIELENGRQGAGNGTTPRPPASSGGTFVVPDYNAMGDDAYFVDKIGTFVEAEMKASPEKHMNAGSASWIARAVHGVMASFAKHGDHRDSEAIALKVRNEMRGVLGKKPVTKLDAKA